MMVGRGSGPSPQAQQSATKTGALQLLPLRPATNPIYFLSVFIKIFEWKDEAGSSSAFDNWQLWHLPFTQYSQGQHKMISIEVTLKYQAGRESMWLVAIAVINLELDWYCHNYQLFAIVSFFYWARSTTLTAWRETVIWTKIFITLKRLKWPRNSVTLNK